MKTLIIAFCILTTGCGHTWSMVHHFPYIARIAPHPTYDEAREAGYPCPCGRTNDMTRKERATTEE
jgi:hypothetical protein